MKKLMAAGVYQFADVTLDLDRFELYRAGVQQHVEPQVLEVLAYLVRNRDRLVSKQELMDEVWHDRFISDSAISSRIKAARRVTGDDGERQNVIRTVHGRGYRFVAELVTEFVSERAAGAAAPTQMAICVGRDDELATMDAALAAARSGGREVIMISGEPGIGKTALVEEFIASVSGTTSLVGVGQCHPVGAGEPYAPLLDALSDLAAGPASAVVRHCLDELAPGWLLQLPALTTAEQAASLVDRTLGSTPERMLREALELFDALASQGQGPLVIAIEDLHWADRPTVDLLTAVARRRRPAPLLVLGTYRHTDLDDDHPLPGTVSELVIRRLATHLRLEALSLEAATELAVRRRASAPPPEAMAALHRRSGGNPLFLGALLDTTADHEGNADLPQTLREMVEHHLDRLSPTDRNLIETAAVAGIEFGVQLLESEAEIDQAWQRCDALARRDQLIAFGDGDRPGHFRFRHSLYQEVTYSRVPVPRLRTLHRLVGERLEATTGDSRACAAELAEHFTRAEDARRAVLFRLQAAEVAALRNAPAEALAHLRAGLEMLPLLPDGPQRQRAEADLMASCVAMAISVEGWDSPHAEQGLRRARELYLELNDIGAANRMTYGIAGLHEYRGQFDQTQLLMRQRLESVAGDERALVELNDLLACSLFHMGEFDDSLRHALEALAHYDSDRDRTALAFVGENSFVTSSHWAAYSLWFTGHPDAALEHSQAALRIARRPDYAFSLCMALEQAATLHQLRQEPDRVLELADEMHSLAVKGGLPYRQATSGVLRAWARARWVSRRPAAATSKPRWPPTVARARRANCRIS